MNRLLLYIICCLLSVSLSAQTPNEQRIIQEMASAAEKIRTVQCNFTQTKHMKMLSKEMVSKGIMYCQPPDKLRWEYTTPRASTLILDNTVPSKSSRGETSGAVAPPRGSWRGAASLIMNSVAGKCLTDSKNFQVTAQEKPTEYVATLLPLKKDMKRIYTKLVLHFNREQQTVTEVELYEKNGDRTVIELHDIRINEE